ncbi:hypothetical protein NC796_17235 [Aliifodinibius sp. S!AR15-10]|nr:hypothetical protein [Aliifodinibius sp. S!AR15-10]
MAQVQDLGLFEGHTDIGNPHLAGSVEYDSENQVHTLSGAGKNMWFSEDQFHYVYRKMTGDFILHTRAEFIGEGVNSHRKIGWIVRSGLGSSSAHVNAAVHGDGLTSLQFRRAKGDSTEEIQSPVKAPDVIQLEREGNTFTMSVAKFGNEFTPTTVKNIDLGDEVYVGIYVCSHEPEVIEEARFRNVRIIKPAWEGLVPYQDYLGSNLEVMEVETGHRKILYQSNESLQAPNWTPDGSKLIYNHNGLLYNYNLEENRPEILDTDFAINNNNDHVLTFDGSMLGISHHTADADGASIIYTMPADGGVPKRVTPKGPSYLHGWSPDNKFVTYTGGRDGNYDIYKIPVEGGDEIRLTTDPSLDDGSEYTPDGKYIYFNSARTGSMEIWRMKPDGSEQEQLTNDKLNNWFPHISPDGKRVLFLSYSESVDPEDHPFYKRVYLRIMPLDGGEPKVIAYLYGGQGTINVPSWSPDGRHISFVSNSGDISVSSEQ